MADFGLARAIRKAVVKRPGQLAAEEAKVVAKKAAKVESTAAATAAVRKEAQDVLAPKPEPTPAPGITADRPLVLPEEQLQPEMAAQIKAGGEEQAKRLSTANLGDYALDEPWQTNFDTITTTDDIKAVIADVAQQNSTKIQESRRGVITNDQLKGLANDLNVSEDVIRPVLEREAGGTLRPEVILASRQVLNSSAERVLTLAKKVKSGQANDFDRLAFRRQIMFHNEYQTQFMGARAEAGRALNAFGIPVGSDANQLARMRELVENLHGHDTDKLAEVLSNVDSVQGVNKLTREYSRSKLMGVTQELFINSILSGPKTHLVNSIGNGLFQSMNIAETAVAARLGRFLSGDEHVMAGEASAMIYGTLSGWRDGLRLAGRSARTGTSIDNLMKYEGQGHRAISAQNLLPARQQDTMLGAAVDGLGAFIRAPTERVMVPTDEFFKTVAYRAELSRQAYAHVQQRVNGGELKPGEAEKAITEFMENPPASAQALAQDYISYVTFQNPLGPTGQKWQTALGHTPAGFLIAPFVRTPVNIFKAGVAERSPLAVFSAQWRAQVARGGRDRDLALARAGMGTLTVGMVAAAAINGHVTGGGPQNPDARKAWLAAGNQPYSFRLENPITGEITHQSYARGEPLAYVIGATADTVEIMAFLDNDDELKSEQEQLNNAIAAITAGVANNTMSKTFMSGVADFSEAMSDPKRYMAGFMSRTAGAMIPYSAFRRQINQIEDPVIREAWTLSDQLRTQSGIPGFSEDSPPKRDIFGEPIYHRGGSLLGVMSPFPDTKETTDQVLREVVSVMNETRKVPIMMPGKRVDGMKLTAPEYDELIRYSRSYPLPSGRTFHEELERTIGSSAYLLATPDTKVELIKYVQQAADDYGKAMLEKNNADFAERMATYRAKKDALKFGEQ